MAEERDDDNPLDQLIDLFVYAPVGLLYEYPDVLPKLIKRGKSQVQVAQVLAKLAMGGRGGAPGVDMADVAAVAATLVGRAISDFGTAMGWPSESDRDDTSPASEPRPARPRAAPTDPALKAGATDDSATDAPSSDDADPDSLAIAGYDDLTAREIIALLDGVAPDELAAVRAHELAGRSRKTVLAKLDRLDK